MNLLCLLGFHKWVAVCYWECFIMGTGELTWHWMGYKCKNCCKKKVELNPRIKKKPLDPDCIEWLQTGFNINARRISHEPIRHHPRKHMRRIK